MKNDYDVRGDITAIFINCEGKEFETSIDTCNLQIAQSIPNRWYGSKDKLTNNIYVMGKTAEGKTVQLHRWIYDDTLLENDIMDHKSHNTLLNTRENLRVTTIRGNAQNRKGANKGSKTGIRGVTFRKDCGKYQARVRLNYKSYHLGYFESEVEAESAAKKFRELNMPFSSEARGRG